MLTKSLLTKHKSYLLEAPYRTSETSKLELFTKRLKVYSQKLFSQKVLSSMFERVLNNTNIYFEEWYSPQLLNISSKSIDLMQSTIPLFNNSLTPPYKLQKIKIFKTDFRELSILSKLWEWCIWEGVGERLVCVIMTHCVQKLICDSALNETFVR